MSSSPPGASPSRTLRLTGIAISAISLTGVAIWASSQPVPDLPTTPSGLLFLAIAVLVYACATLTRGERAYRLLVRAGADANRSDATGLTVVGYMGNTVLPARGGDAIRAYLQAQRAKTTVRAVVGMLVAERVLDLILLFSMFVILGYVVLRGIDTPSTAALLVTAGLAVLAFGAVFLILRFFGENPRVRSARDFFAPMAESTGSLRGRHGVVMLCLTGIIWLLEAATWYAVAQAVDLGMSPVEALYLVALASVFVLIPSGPGYAGTLDAAVLFGTSAIGATGAESVGYLITLRFVLLVPITLCGLALLITRYGGFANAWQRRGVATR